MIKSKIEKIVSELLSLAKRKPLSKENLDTAKKCMIWLRARGFTSSARFNCVPFNLALKGGFSGKHGRALIPADRIL